MRRGVKWAVGLAFVLALLVGGVCRFPVDIAVVRAALDQSVSPRLGLRWGGPQRATLALLPWPTLRLENVTLIGADDRPVISAPVASLPLSASALFAGRFAPTGATLLKPIFSVDLDSASLAAAERGAFSNKTGGAPALWSRVRVRGGALRVVSPTRGLEIVVERLDGSFDWPRADEPLTLSLAGLWRGENIALKGEIDDPRVGLEAQATGVRFEVASYPLSLAADGTWGGDVAPAGFVGDISAQVRSFGEIERLVDIAPAPLIVGDAFSIVGKARTHGAAMMVNDARVELAGQRFEGALALSRAAERTSLSGTLAADEVDLDPFFGSPSALFDARGAWSDRSFAFSPWRDLDLDLRLSAARAGWGGRHIDDVAGSLNCDDGRLTATLLQAAAYQGVLKGQLTAARTAKGVEAQATGSLANADIGAALADFGQSGYHGRGGLEFSLRATGMAPADTAASLSGTVSLDLQGGVIEGVNLEEALRRSQRRPIDLARDMGVGRTAFTRAHAQLAIADGVATMRDARIDGPAAVVALDGTIDIAARRLRARLAATQADAQGAPSTDAARLTITVDGPWSAPAVAALPGGS